MGGAKVTVVGATSKGVDSQGTILNSKDSNADGLFLTHPQDARCFSGNSGGAYTVVTSTGLQTFAVCTVGWLEVRQSRAHSPLLQNREFFPTFC